MKPTARDHFGGAMQTDLPSAAMASTHKHSRVVGAVIVVSFLTILARVGISGAKVEMAHDLNISDVAFGLVFGAFALGYAVFMIPCGLLADRWGPRKSLTLSVFFWSLFTLCTGLASGVSLIIAIRFLFGLAEAGVFPQATRALHNWTLPRERGLALGLLNMGSRLGAAFGLVFTPLCVQWLGWRKSFVLLGILGAVWSAIWFLWFRDKPATGSHRQAAEASSAKVAREAAGSKIPWRALFSSRNFYLITFQYFASQFTFFICFSWLLPYSKVRYGVTTGQAGLYSSVPLCCGALAMWIGGSAVDRMYKAGKWKASRGLPAMLGLGLAAATMLPAPFMPSLGSFIACFALTTFGLDLTVSSSWTVCCDVGGEYSGTLSAAMNTAGALGSFASSLLFPILTGWAGNITTYFGLAALLNIVALVCWRYIEPGRSLFQKKNQVTSNAPIQRDEVALP
jgi:ACS family glucarate transporter-like MFS transporter